MVEVQHLLEFLEIEAGVILGDLAETDGVVLVGHSSYLIEHALLKLGFVATELDHAHFVTCDYHLLIVLTFVSLEDDVTIGFNANELTDV